MPPRNNGGAIVSTEWSVDSFCWQLLLCCYQKSQQMLPKPLPRERLGKTSKPYFVYRETGGTGVTVIFLKNHGVDLLFYFPSVGGGAVTAVTFVTLLPERLPETVCGQRGE